MRFRAIIILVAGTLVGTASPSAAQLAVAPVVAAGAQDAAVQQPGAASMLQSLVIELERSNPELQAARRDIDMRTARISPAGAPPDPSLSFGYMGGFLRPPFFPSSSTPDGFRQFGVSQEIPYPGKLGLRSNIAATEAEAARWNAEDVRLGLIAELKASYVDYVLAHRSLEIIARNKQLLEQMRDIAAAQFRVGKGLQQDVFKAQLEISMLLERAAMLEQQGTTARARVNALLYRPQDSALPAQLTFETAQLPHDLQPWRALTRERYPAVRRDEQLIQRGQQGLALARKEVLPDFAVNLRTEQPVGGMPWSYGVDVMVKVPLFWQRKQRPMIAEAAASLEAGRRMRENTLAQAHGAVTEGYVMASTAQRLITLYGDSILPQARLTLESSLAAYRVGSADYLTVLTNFASVLASELSYEQQQAQFWRALAALEPYVADTLIR